MGNPDSLDDVFVGEVAHIVSDKESGPRGKSSPPGGDRNEFPNLMLLCPEHHALIDSNASGYSVAKLLKMKEEHESWVRTRVSPAERLLTVEDGVIVAETAHLNVMPVLHMPVKVFRAPCKLDEDEIAAALRQSSGRARPGVALPFICRAEQLIAFDNLADDACPLVGMVDVRSVACDDARGWWQDADRCRWYMQLLNRALNKLTGRRGLHLDREHQRYFFTPEDGPQPRSIAYRSLQGHRSSRQVAYRPRVRKTGEQKNYWEHYAVGLRFHRLEGDQWCLSIRPERRFTRDGYNPLTPKGIGRRSGSRKAHMYNEDVLREVFFWCEFFANGEPRVHLPLGAQDLVLDPSPLSLQVDWPGVPGDQFDIRVKPAEETLFTHASYRQILQREADLGEWDVVDEDDWAEDPS